MTIMIIFIKFETNLKMYSDYKKYLPLLFSNKASFNYQFLYFIFIVLNFHCHIKILLNDMKFNIVEPN